MDKHANAMNRIKIYTVPCKCIGTPDKYEKRMCFDWLFYLIFHAKICKRNSTWNIQYLYDFLQCFLLPSYSRGA